MIPVPVGVADDLKAALERAAKMLEQLPREPSLLERWDVEDAVRDCQKALTTLREVLDG